MQTKPGTDFSAEETQRYSRNALLDQVGWEGQARWRAGKVLVVGAGGLGSAALLYLAAAGVGRLGIVDRDAVELSNLQRQILHRTADLGRRKVASAAESLAALNPRCRLETFDLRLDPANVREVVPGFETGAGRQRQFYDSLPLGGVLLATGDSPGVGRGHRLARPTSGAMARRGKPLLPLPGAGGAPGGGRACGTRGGHPGRGGRGHGLPPGSGGPEAALGPGIGPEPPPPGL